MTGLFVSGLALADDNDPASIEQRLKALETSAEHRTLVREPAAKARKALKRVLEARTAGDAAHAVELAALANDWVNLAANVIRAVELEKEVVSQQSRLSELEQKRRRTETLLEATIAQRERTREELKRFTTTQTTNGTQKSDSRKSAPRGSIPRRGESTETSTTVRPASRPAASTSAQPATLPTLAPRPSGAIAPPKSSIAPRGN